MRKMVRVLSLIVLTIAIVVGRFMMPVTGVTVQAAEPLIKVEPADAQISFNLPHVGASIDRTYRFNCEEVVSSAHFGDGILNVEASIYCYDEGSGDILPPEEDTLIADKKYVLLFCPFTKYADGYYFFEPSEVEEEMDESTTRTYFTSIPSGASFLQAVKDARNDFYAFFIFEPLKDDPTPDPGPTPTPPAGPSSPAHTHNFQWQTITAPTQYEDGLEGEVCSCGAIRNTQPLSAYAYALNEYATPMINAAKSGQTITFEFGMWNSFPKSFMEKLVNKSASGVTFIFHYKWNHVKQEITIPAGTPIDLNFDWYGPAKMAELYGNN